MERIRGWIFAQSFFESAGFFAPYAHVRFDFWEEYVEISLLDDLGGEVKRSGEMSVVITTHCLRSMT